MIIRHNLVSANTNNNLNTTTTIATKSREKLSSGLRINQAADDAAGLSISEKMKGQIRGLGQASRNVQDGVSFLQIADDGLGSILSPYLQRMRELTIQAGNGTYSNEDLQIIQNELDQLKHGIDDIATGTNFNGITMLNRAAHPEFLISDSGVSPTFDYTNVLAVPPVNSNGSFNFKTNLGYPTTTADNNQILVYGGGSTSFPAVIVDGTSYNLSHPSQSNPLVCSFTPTVQNGNSYDTVYHINALGIDVTQSIQTVKDKYEIKYTVENNSGSPHNIGIYFHIDTKLGSDDAAPFIVNGAEISIATEYVTGNVPDSFTVYNHLNGSSSNPQFQAAGILTGPDIIETPSRFLIGMYDTIKDWGCPVPTSPVNAVGDSGYSLTWDPRTVNSGNTFSVNTFYGQSIPPTILDPDTNETPIYQMLLQVGANEGNIYPINLVDAKSSFIGVATINILDPSTIGANLTKIDKAIQLVSGWRSTYGANQNALAHIDANLLTTEENTTAAQSKICDVDMAKEIVVLQKNNILIQAAQAMLTQANQQPQGVLQLLRQ